MVYSSSRDTHAATHVYSVQPYGYQQDPYLSLDDWGKWILRQAGVTVISPEVKEGSGLLLA